MFTKDAIIVLYENINQQYERAFNLLSGLSQKYPNEVYLRFYSGISLIELNKLHEAIITLQPLTENDNDFSDQATWY